ncbi:MAG TPA: ABC transporter ATP-binding protein [Symbiobacteriaceae bacterium]
MLGAQNVSLAYQTGGIATYALKGATVQVAEGEFLGLMGPSGSGKSTLLYLLSGLKTPTDGHIWYRNHRLSDMLPADRAQLRQRHFGLIFQMHFLINYLTVLENILVALPAPTSANEKRALDLMERFDMAHLRGRFPHQLSGGQRQRVAALRAMVAEPEVIFADEPTASLDHVTGGELMKALTEYQVRGGTLVVVTHDSSILGAATRTLKVWDGRLREESA